MRLLLVEDDASLAGTLIELLTEEGYHVTPAATRQAALHLARTELWDLVLASTLSPPHPQPEPGDLIFLRTLAAHAPVALLTAQAWARRVRPADLGVRAILAKPFDLDELLGVLRRTACPGHPGRLLQRSA